MPITFSQAALGAEVTVPTIDGRIEYKIPEGTQTGTTFRMRGKGIQNVNGRGRGDQYVRVNIEVPKNLSDKQKSCCVSSRKRLPTRIRSSARASGIR